MPVLKSFSGTPAPLADWYVEQASRENIGHGDVLSPSVVLTTCIVSAGETGAGQCGSAQ